MIDIDKPGGLDDEVEARMSLQKHLLVMPNCILPSS